MLQSRSLAREMNIASSLVLLPCLGLCSSVSAWGQVNEDLKLVASDGEEFDNFGYWHRQPMGQPATFSGAISVKFQ